MFIDYRSPRERAGQFQPKTKKISGRTILEGLGMVAGIVAILLWTTLEMAPAMRRERKPGRIPPLWSYRRRIRFWL